jgi:hypothetical protein
MSSTDFGRDRFARHVRRTERARDRPACAAHAKRRAWRDARAPRRLVLFVPNGARWKQRTQRRRGHFFSPSRRSRTAPSASAPTSSFGYEVRGSISWRPGESGRGRSHPLGEEPAAVSERRLCVESHRSQRILWLLSARSSEAIYAGTSPISTPCR